MAHETVEASTEGGRAKVAEAISESPDEPTLEELLSKRRDLLVVRDKQMAVSTQKTIGDVNRMIFPEPGGVWPESGPELVVLTGTYGGNVHYILETRFDNPDLFQARDELRVIEATGEVQHYLEIEAVLSQE